MLLYRHSFGCHSLFFSPSHCIPSGRYKLQSKCNLLWKLYSNDAIRYGLISCYKTSSFTTVTNNQLTASVVTKLSQDIECRKSHAVRSQTKSLIRSHSALSVLIDFATLWLVKAASSFSPHQIVMCFLYVCVVCWGV